MPPDEYLPHLLTSSPPSLQPSHHPSTFYQPPHHPSISIMLVTSVGWCTLLLLLCSAFANALVTQSEADAFLKWLDTRNEFSSSFQRKFTLVPSGEDDFGFLGNVKPVAIDDIDHSFNYKKEIEKHFEDDLLDMLHLLHEKHNEQNSDWAPYLKVLPSTFTTPIFWTKKQIDELLGTSVYGQIMRLNGTIARDYQRVISNTNYSRLFPDSSAPDKESQKVNEADLVTLQEFRWAYSVFRSRNWKTPKGPKISPVLELFNYGQESNVKVVLREDYVDLIAETALAKGDTLIINDGLIGNRELLEWYGFVTPNNRNDYYPVGVGLDDEENLFGMKKSYFKQRGIVDGQTFQLKTNLIPRDLIFALRIFHVNLYDSSDINNALEGIKTNKVISAQNEMSMCNTIIDLCEDSLDNLSHSLKSDKALLESDDVTGPLRSAVVLRRTEKKILVSILKLAKMQAEDVKRHWSTRSMEIPTVTKQY